MPLAANSANPKPSSIPDTPTLGHAVVDIFTHRRNFYVELRNWGRLPERDPDTRLITHFESSGNYHSPSYCVHNAMLHLYKALSKQLVMTTFCRPGDPYYATVEDVYFQFPGTEGEDKRLYLATLALLQQLSGFDVLSILQYARAQGWSLVWVSRRAKNHRDTVISRMPAQSLDSSAVCAVHSLLEAFSFQIRYLGALPYHVTSCSDGYNIYYPAAGTMADGNQPLRRRCNMDAKSMVAGGPDVLMATVEHLTGHKDRMVKMYARLGKKFDELRELPATYSEVCAVDSTLAWLAG